MKKISLSKLKNKTYYKPIVMGSVCAMTVGLVGVSIKAATILNDPQNNSRVKSTIINAELEEEMQDYDLGTEQYDSEEYATGSTTKGTKVSILKKYLSGENSVTEEYAPENNVKETTGKDSSEGKDTGAATKLEDMQYEITKNVLNEVESHYAEVIVGATGAKGEQGKQGIQGIQGKQGVPGKQGIQGEQGKQGIQGIQGEQGKQGADGKDGVDGASTFIFFADDTNGNGFSTSPTNTTKYMASITTNKSQSSITKEDLTGKWEKYKDISLTAVTDSTGKTTIKILQ